jgi:CRP/FNR family cyclic AMP-dependent transcriptional regulator
MTAVDLFRAQRLFADLDGSDAEAVAALARRRAWAAGTTIFQRGDAGREMILVTSGRIRLSVLSAEGRELGLRHAEAGALIGEIAVLDGGPRSADATAATDVEALVIAKPDLDRLIAARPQIALAFLRFLCGRLRDTTEQLETVALYKLEARLARFLLGLVRQRTAGKETGDSVRFELPFNQSEIADVIGASRPKVNRAFADLEEAGAVRRTDDGLVCRLGRLAEIAEGEAG